MVVVVVVVVVVVTVLVYLVLELYFVSRTRYESSATLMSSLAFSV